MQAIYTAASGLKGQQTRLDTIAANLANVSTTGYKASRVDFKDTLYTLMDSPLGDAEGRNLLTGTGVRLGSTGADFGDGMLEETGQSLDFAITGAGFFTAERGDGTRIYTRDGSFQVSAEGENNYLVTAQGYYVLDEQGNRISLPEDLSQVSLAQDGTLQTGDGQGVRLAISGFPNPDGLLAVGGSDYIASEASGDPAQVTDTRLEQGSLERSNVELSQELTLLMRSQRAYSLASRALQTADEMEGLANHMR